MNTFANIVKYILGVLLAVAILAGGGVAVALYFMNQTSLNPSKPIYDNDTSQVKGQLAKSQIKGLKSSGNVANNQIQPSPMPSDTPSSSSKSLPPGAYSARVSWSSGLILRKEPQEDAEHLGGISFNQKVIVLQKSDDKVWEKIRLQDNNEEGWVKAGNTEKVDDNQDSQPQEKAKPTDDNQDSQPQEKVKPTDDNQDSQPQEKAKPANDNQNSQSHRKVRRTEKKIRYTLTQKNKATDNKQPIDQLDQ